MAVFARFAAQLGEIMPAVFLVHTLVQTTLVTENLAGMHARMTPRSATGSLAVVASTTDVGGKLGEV